MKRKMTAIIAGTMLAITGAMPASATVVNTNLQYLTVARNHQRQVVLNRLTSQPEGMTVAKCMRRKSREGRWTCKSTN